MIAKTLFGALLLVLIASEETRAAGIEGKVTVQGDLKGGQLWIEYWGTGKKAELVHGGMAASIPGVEVGTLGGGVKGNITFGKEGSDWKYTIEGILPGAHLLCAMYVEKGADSQGWPRRTVWKWIHLKDAKDTLKQDLALDLAPDAKEIGTIEAKAAKGQVGFVAFLPMDGVEPSDPLLANFDSNDKVYNMLHTGPFLNNKTVPSVKLTGLAPGKYRVFVQSDKPVDVEVKGGETATAQAAAEVGK